MGEAMRPILAMVTGHLTPYRTHLNRRMARELSEFSLRTIVTKNASTMWKTREDPEIGTVLLDRTDTDWEKAGRLQHIRHEFSKGRTLVRWLNEHRPAAVICAGYDEVPNMMAARWCRSRRTPCFLTADSNIRSDTSRGAKRLLKRLVVPRLVRSFTGVMACGRLGRAYFEYYGARPESIFRVPLEPDYDQILSIGPDQVDAARARHGLDPARRRLVMCQRLIPLKRTDLVVRAFAAIAPERPEWDVVIIGDGPERGRIEALIPADLAPRVRMLGFIADMTEIGAIYKACDLLVLASMHDAWSLVINEALAAGLAVAGSDVVGAVPEMVHEGVNGAVFPPGDLEALTRALRRATAPGDIDRFKAASIRVLADWRSQADPVDGVRQALRWAGVMPAAAPDTGSAASRPRVRAHA